MVDDHKSLGRRLLDKKLFKGEIGKVICGVPHWVVQFYDWENPFVKTDILYFDLNEEVFKEIDRPSRCVEKTMLGLAAMNGENELGCVVHDVVSSNVELWVMKEYGKIESWTNLFTFSCMNLSDDFGCIRYMDVMGYMPNNGELLIYLNDEKLLVYDVYEDNYREIKLEGIEVEFMVSFEPKLISPPKPIKESGDESQTEDDEDEDDDSIDDYSHWRRRFLYN
ncbi:hypothetical protein RND81_13G143600 [Saponaria officinalis]|uniref:F-box associated beta-propeller type 3 domain-containing protein n=1 Tax=Saponaria officinalis TaxID=3572 RepID=A0AAW1GXN9_SAPOF